VDALEMVGQPVLRVNRVSVLGSAIMHRTALPVRTEKYTGIDTVSIN